MGHQNWPPRPQAQVGHPVVGQRAVLNLRQAGRVIKPSSSTQRLIRARGIARGGVARQGGVENPSRRAARQVGTGINATAQGSVAGNLIAGNRTVADHGFSTKQMHPATMGAVAGSGIAGDRTLENGNVRAYRTDTAPCG